MSTPIIEKENAQTQAAQVTHEKQEQLTQEISQGRQEDPWVGKKRSPAELACAKEPAAKRSKMQIEKPKDEDSEDENRELRKHWGMDPDDDVFIPFGVSWKITRILEMMMTEGPDGNKWIAPMSSTQSCDWAGHPTRGSDWQRASTLNLCTKYMRAK